MNIDQNEHQVMKLLVTAVNLAGLAPARIVGRVRLVPDADTALFGTSAANPFVLWYNPDGAVSKMLNDKGVDYSVSLVAHEINHMGAMVDAGLIKDTVSKYERVLDVIARYDGFSGDAIRMSSAARDVLGWRDTSAEDYLINAVLRDADAMTIGELANKHGWGVVDSQERDA